MASRSSVSVQIKPLLCIDLIVIYHAEVVLLCYVAFINYFQDIPHQKALNVDSATEIPWNDPHLKNGIFMQEFLRNLLIYVLFYEYCAFFYELCNFS